MKKKLLVILALLSFFPFIVNAKSCSDTQINDKKTLASKIDWAYEYYLKNNKMYFDVIVTNVFEDLYIINVQNGKKYNNSEFVIQKLSDDQKMTFEIYSKNCNSLVSIKELYLPKYNTFYGTKYCEGISEFSYCGKWSNLGNSIDANTLKEETDKYRQSLIPSTTETVMYETNITGFYIFISLILISLSLLLIVLKVGRIKKNFI